jgi:nitroreductase
MDFLQLARRRQSVREYSEQVVEREKIERCLEAAWLAPSACNSQPWKFVVVDDPKLKEAVAREASGKLIAMNRFALQAPVLILIVSQKPKLSAQVGGIIKNRPYYLIDIGIAAEHICLQAVEEGLGTCIMGWFNENKLQKLLQIPAYHRIDLVICMGYPKSDQIRPKIRKEIDQIRCFNQYQ